ncbi:hypothetical protein PO227_21085, partial [Bacteroides ovatus]|nr:hypothetical protein [Bacteroides ovatus]
SATYRNSYAFFYAIMSTYLINLRNLNYNTIQETAKELGYWWESAGSPNYSVATYTINGKHELFPIPQRDMDLCILFNQNPKW